MRKQNALIEEIKQNEQKPTRKKQKWREFWDRFVLKNSKIGLLKTCYYLNLNKVTIEVLVIYNGDMKSLTILSLLNKKSQQLWFSNTLNLTKNIFLTLIVIMMLIIRCHWLYIKVEETRLYYGKGREYRKDVVEDFGNSCYIPTSGSCFIKINSYSTGEDY